MAQCGFGRIAARGEALGPLHGVPVTINSDDVLLFGQGVSDEYLNLYRAGLFSAAELKTIQEIITLSVFAVFSVFYLKEPLHWNHALGFAFIALGAFFIFHKWA